MSDIVDYVILGLFFVFVLYFVYVVLDTLVFSKRRRRVKTNLPKADSSKSESSDGDKKEEKVAKADHKTSDNDKSSSSNESDKNKTEKNKKKSKGSFTRLFSGISFKKLLNRGKDNSRANVRVDEQYDSMLQEFFTKTHGNWTKEKFYDFFSDVVKKGYDVKPSEVSESLEIIRKQRAEESRIKAEANMVDKNASSEKIVDEEPKKEEDSDGTYETLSDKKKELDDAEKELKDAVSKKEQPKDTRDELDKTLSEIRQIRKRLSDFEE